MLKKRILIPLVVIVSGLLILNLSRNIIRLLRSEREVGKSQRNLERLQVKQEALLEKKEYLGSEEFIEEQARDKLNMAREGEMVVVLPSGTDLASKKEDRVVGEMPNWQKWLKVFGF